VRYYFEEEARNLIERIEWYLLVEGERILLIEWFDSEGEVRNLIEGDWFVPKIESCCFEGER
jgi:hypothetical protein